MAEMKRWTWTAMIVAAMAAMAGPTWAGDTDWRTDQEAWCHSSELRDGGGAHRNGAWWQALFDSEDISSADERMSMVSQFLRETYDFRFHPLLFNERNRGGGTGDMFRNGFNPVRSTSSEAWEATDVARWYVGAELIQPESVLTPADVRRTYKYTRTEGDKMPSRKINGLILHSRDFHEIEVRMTTRNGKMRLEVSSTDGHHVDLWLYDMELGRLYEWTTYDDVPRLSANESHNGVMYGAGTPVFVNPSGRLVAKAIARTEADAAKFDQRYACGAMDFDLVPGLIRVNGMHPGKTNVRIVEGRPFDVKVRVRNRGRAASPAATVTLYRSDSQSIDTSTATVLGTADVGVLDPQTTESVETEVIPPVDMSVGTHWVGACVVASVTEADVTNNCTHLSTARVVVRSQ